MIRELSPLFPENEQDRRKLLRWIHTLVHPLNATQTIEIRQKRNQYLFIICSALLTGNVGNFLKIARREHLRVDAPKKSKFVKVRGMRSSAPVKPNIADKQGFPISLASAVNPLKLANPNDFLETPEWQKARFWTQRLQNEEAKQKATMKKSSKARVAQPKKDEKKCTVHANDCPTTLVNSKIGKCLDNQFEYLLAMCESYKELQRESGRSSKINAWLQTLAKIDKDCCANMKGIRNDYAMILVGYLVNCELKGPFEDFPSQNLQPLTESIATYIQKRSIDVKAKSKNVPLNPASDTIESFMINLPKIEEGAFALLSLSGNLFTPMPDD